MKELSQSNFLFVHFSSWFFFIVGKLFRGEFARLKTVEWMRYRIAILAVHSTACRSITRETLGREYLAATAAFVVPIG